MLGSVYPSLADGRELTYVKRLGWKSTGCPGVNIEPYSVTHGAGATHRRLLARRALHGKSIRRPVMSAHHEARLHDVASDSSSRML